MDIVTSAEMRQTVGDLTWAVWRALVGRPQFSALPPEAFIRLRRALEDAVATQWRFGGWAGVLDVERWSAEMTDEVAPLLETMIGSGMARGPLGVLVTDALRAGLAPRAGRLAFPAHTSAAA